MAAGRPAQKRRRRHAEDDRGVAEAPGREHASRPGLVILACVAITVFCALATAGLVAWNVWWRKGDDVIVKHLPSPLAEADRARAEGEALMLAGRFTEAVGPLEAAIAAYTDLRRKHPGSDYSYLETEIVKTNVLLWTAKEQALIGNPLPVPAPAPPDDRRRRRAESRRKNYRGVRSE